MRKPSQSHGTGGRPKRRGVHPTGLTRAPGAVSRVRRMETNSETVARAKVLRRRQWWLLGSALLCGGVLKSAMKGEPTLIVAMGVSFLLHLLAILALEWRRRAK